MTVRRYELTDKQWEQIKHYFEVPNKNGRPYKNLKNTANEQDITNLPEDSLLLFT